MPNAIEEEHYGRLHTGGRHRPVSLNRKGFRRRMNVDLLGGAVGQDMGRAAKRRSPGKPGDDARAGTFTGARGERGFMRSENYRV